MASERTAGEQASESLQRPESISEPIPAAEEVGGTEYRYCPLCGTRLVRRELFGRIRPQCPACGFIYFQDPKVAVIALITRGKQVLLIRRGVDPGRGKWALPGGFMDAGEMPQEALRREVQEEVGLAVEIQELLGIYPMAGPGARSRGIVLAYRAVPTQAVGMTLVCDDDADEARWFTPAEVPGELAFESTRTLLARWKAEIDGASP
ncbi:MAG: ADP-ribose pyrophosphatase [Litorilinea sp.]|nr:MAG: ADP-ribose pyrophosphatase [Litorilinea sp.]